LNIIEIVILVLGLSMNSFAVSVSCSMHYCINLKKAAKVALFLSLFQTVMPVIGWLLGSVILSMIANAGQLIAFSILIIIGIKMIIGGLKTNPESRSFDINRMVVLIGLSVATSIDAFITGISFDLLEMPIATAAIVFFIVTFIVSLSGVYINKKSKYKYLGAKAYIFGGLILIGIGVKEILSYYYVI